VRVPAVCAYPQCGLPTLAEVAKHNKVPLPPSGWAHDSKRRLTRIVPPVPGLWLCFTHADCVCNEIVSATNRVVGEVPRPTPDGLRLLRAAARRIARVLPRVEPYSYEQVISMYTGMRKARYTQALRNVQLHGLCKRLHARISAFVKAEKFNPDDKVNPDPRMIQARSAEYGLVIATYLKPIEHYLYKLRGPMGVRCIAKGLNQRQRGALLMEKMAAFTDPVVVSLDASRWDKHVSREVLRVEHSVYLHCLNDPVFARLLSWQLTNYCRAARGTKYAVLGGRMSGDMNTALGNCLLMVIMVHASMKWCSRWDLMDDGDDCLVICESTELERLREELPKAFLEFGQELKIENVARDIRDVVFCQSKVVMMPDGPMFTRNWRRCLSQDSCGSKHWDDPKLIRPMCGTVGLGNLAVSRGVPILQEHAIALIRLGEGRLLNFEFDRGLEIRTKVETGVELRDLKLDPWPILAATREQFARTWGVSIGEQLLIEDTLRGWAPDLDVVKDYDLEWDSTWCSHVDLDNYLPELL